MGFFDFFSGGVSKAQLDAALSPLIQGVNHMAGMIQDLVDEVAALKTVEQSAVALLDGLKSALDAAIAAGDMSAVQKVVDDLKAQQADLAAAVTRNTPSA